jgi:hypothetical protein
MAAKRTIITTVSSATSGTQRAPSAPQAERRDIKKHVPFILSSERDRDAKEAFSYYAAYLKDNRSEFPPSAYALATSDWYFDFSCHHAPHDAWFESLIIGEVSSGARREVREAAITIKLLGAYHDGYIELHYPRVYEYRLTAMELSQGHGDWLYDEFRLDKKERLIHEIEWAAYGARGTWLIVASDVQDAGEGTQ